VRPRPPGLPPADADREELRTLTEDEAALVWPALTEDLRLHRMLCPGAWFGVAQEEWERLAAPR
jgi:hypothetical protein